jgi:hypothetical protein
VCAIAGEQKFLEAQLVAVWTACGYDTPSCFDMYGKWPMANLRPRDSLDTFLQTNINIDSAK